MVTFKVSDIPMEKVGITLKKYEDVKKMDWQRLDPNTPRRKPGEPEPKHVEYRYELLHNSFDKEGEFYRVGVNSFVHAAVNAYNYHHKLEIRPDDVWMSIVTQFSIFVNCHAEALRTRLVNFKDKQVIEIELDSPIREVTDYTKVIGEFEKEIDARVKDPAFSSWLVPDFSTTTETDRVVGKIALMSSLQHFFTYVNFFMCGIPEVTLHGTIQDWEKIRMKAEKLLEYDIDKGYMAKWCSLLLPVLDNLVKTARNEIDISWWKRIATTVGEGSSICYLTGWLSVFCVFDNQGKWLGENKMYYDHDDQGIAVERLSEWTCCDLLYIPKGFTKVPVIIRERGVELTALLFAGHIFAKLVDEYTITPRLDWAVVLAIDITEEEKNNKKEYKARKDWAQYQVDAALIRIMKKYESLTLDNLLLLVQEQLKRDNLVPSQKYVTDRLAVMEEREYVRQDPPNSKTYIYLP